ncbi:kinase domain-containing [Fusarium albosuccineum]|uniref:Kinase domain-containing n=1 Tax=Fusarium albosuccineum TaxID=1237068 RepID=A0A8H4L6L1_9HYPO|nr:kinase domain-containing [Fusarium albosuccineum]
MSRRREDAVRRELRSRLRPKMSDPDYRTQFLPRNDLHDVLSAQVVEEIIENICHKKNFPRVDVRREIFGEDGGKCRLKILGVLIFVKAKHIINFFEQGVFDTNLPLKSDDNIFSGWQQVDVEGFCEKQYVVLAPVFDLNPPEHHIFDDRQVRMPFLNVLKSNPELRGAYGDVSKISIHHHHHNWNKHLDDEQFNHNEVSCFALKRFYPHSDNAFEDERRALLRFTYPNRGHEHIIKLLLSYQIKDVCYLVFPWAKHNLVQFWKNTRSDFTPLLQRWLIGQCRGIADGLLKVYQHGSWKGNESISATKIRGRHGDIKPKNILYFEGQGQKRGRLVIADLGLMRFHSEDTHQHTLAKDVSCTRTYRPPEVDDDDQPVVSQEYDVWTLGCVYLEFITWYLLGYDAIFEDSFCASDGQKRESFSTLRLKEDDKRRHLAQDKFFNWAEDSATFVLKNSVTESKDYSGPPEGISLTPTRLQQDHHNSDFNFLEATLFKVSNTEIIHDGNEPANEPQSNQYLLLPENSFRSGNGSPSVRASMSGSSEPSVSTRHPGRDPDPIEPRQPRQDTPATSNQTASSRTRSSYEINADNAVLRKREDNSTEGVATNPDCHVDGNIRKIAGLSDDVTPTSVSDHRAISRRRRMVKRVKKLRTGFNELMKALKGIFGKSLE